MELAYTIIFYDPAIIYTCACMIDSQAIEPTMRNKTMMRMGSNGFPNNTLLLLYWQESTNYSSRPPCYIWIMRIGPAVVCR